MTFVETPARIAVLGAGPIGLEAALYARFLGYRVRLFERGDVADQVRRWGHLRMITPFGQNCSRLGLAALIAQDPGYRPPAESEPFTGAMWVERYLGLLAHTDLLADSIETQTEVEELTRPEPAEVNRPIGPPIQPVSAEEPLAARPGAAEEAEADEDDDADDAEDDAAREGWMIGLRTTAGVRRELADVVIDATGVLDLPRGCGPGGQQAEGEQALREQLEYGWPDFPGRDRGRYAGRHTLVVGSGCSAITNLMGLIRLSGTEPNTRVTWLAPEGAERMFPGGPTVSETSRHLDGLRSELRRLCLDAARPARVAVQGVRAIRRDGGRLAVEYAADEPQVQHFDRLLVNTGYRAAAAPSPPAAIPIARARRESLAAGPGEMTQLFEPRPPAAVRGRELIQPHADYYVLGTKACGGHGDFTFASGLLQIRDLFALITGRQQLDLYSTIIV